MNVSGSSIAATQSSWGPATMTYSLLDQTTSLPSAPKLSHTHPSPSNPQTQCVYPETLRSISQHPGPHNSHKHTDSSCSSPLYITHHKSHTLLGEECSCVWLHHVIECLVNTGKVCLRQQWCLKLLHLMIFINKSVLLYANSEWSRCTKNVEEADRQPMNELLMLATQSNHHIERRTCRFQHSYIARSTSYRLS